MVVNNISKIEGVLGRLGTSFQLAGLCSSPKQQSKSPVTIFLTLGTLALNDLKSSSKADPYMQLMSRTDLIQNKMVLQDTRSFLLIVKTNQLES